MRRKDRSDDAGLSRSEGAKMNPSFIDEGDLYEDITNVFIWL